MYEAEIKFSESLFVINAFWTDKEYVPEETFGINLKVKTSPSFPEKFLLVDEYDINLNLLPSTMFAEISWSSFLAVNFTELVTYSIFDGKIISNWNPVNSSWFLIVTGIVISESLSPDEEPT